MNEYITGDIPAYCLRFSKIIECKKKNHLNAPFFRDLWINKVLFYSDFWPYSDFDRNKYNS